MNKQSIWTKDFLGMSFSSFFQYMTHYALIAALPVFVMEALNGNAWQAGLAMTFFQIGAVLCRPLAGKWIDECNKKKLLVLSLGIFLAISIMYLGVNALHVLLAIRLLHGAVFAVGTTAVAAVAALLLPAQSKGEGIGYFAMFSNLAMVMGPFFSLTIISHYPFRVLIAGCIILAVLAFWTGTGSNFKKLGNGAVPKKNQSLDWNNFIETAALPMALVGGLVFFAYAGVLIFIPLYAKQLNLAEYTSLFFAVFALLIVITRPVVGKLFDRAGANSVVYPGFFLFAAGLIALSQAQGFAGLLIAGGIIGIGFGALSPVFQTLAVQLSPLQRAGVATATYFLALDISVGLGSFLLSIVASHIGYRGVYLFAAALIACTAFVYYTVWVKIVTGKLSESES
ncbi:putative membrane protein [Propionispora sp. 2/2-37]|uniref:MFS transporter n=1 Tax=Propionispora sp. 2/2-37 TaxID=1677858 RepID=UPI0006BB9167|nr:MFS transporter [Propionispora sp. 2/2-37]CUH94721.1 putative membrane protein [Propionispora sp. 2/2-37]